jgi:hypothetical protein
MSSIGESRELAARIRFSKDVAENIDDVDLVDYTLAFLSRNAQHALAVSASATPSLEVLLSEALERLRWSSPRGNARPLQAGSRTGGCGQ